VWGPFKLVTYPLDYVSHLATNHPFQTIALGLVAWEVTDEGVSDLFRNGGGGSNPPPVPPSKDITTIEAGGKTDRIVTF
jgi:hypothetical protein